MLRISDSVQQILLANEALRFGFHHRLLNLSQVARFLQPLVEARTQKKVSAAAIQMSLSRLQATAGTLPASTGRPFRLDKIHIHPGLCALTLAKTTTSQRDLGKFYAGIQEQNDFITVTEGISEVTAIFESRHLPRARRLLQDKPHLERHSLASLGIRFGEEYLDVPGVLHQILETLALQGINVVEIASTSTEFTVYLHEDDVQLAFESIYGRFARRD